MTKRITSKDIEIAFLINTIDGVKELFKGNKTPGKKVINTAVEALASNGLEVDDLRVLGASLYPSSGKGRGKTQPTVGEKRQYSVQKVKNSAPFIRLPLSTLNVERGALVTVQFKDGAIVVG
jgi:hypothetical protein